MRRAGQKVRCTGKAVDEKVAKRHKRDVTQPKSFYVSFFCTMSLPCPYLMQPTTKTHSNICMYVHQKELR